ncbi:MAG: tetratricopeptide repeat protein [Rubrivivax sp.]|nr:tetratricopeptide repeat protein [Rubrivivax sp.]
MRKIAAILCADVAAYSRLMGDDDVATLHDIVATRRVLHSHVAACSGRLVDTAGDSMLADFGSAVDALRAAVAIQQELAAENALKPEARRMQLRIGLNIGDILEHEAALYGDAVNVAARLQTLGEVGGVCVSAAVHDLVHGRIPVAFEYAGEHVVKNVRQPVRVFHVRWGGEPDARDILTRASTRAGGVQHVRLPQPLSSFVGREEPIQALRNLAAQHRLITIVGPGGIGKTRLAQRIAELRTPSQSVWFVELASIDDDRLLPKVVAASLGIHEQAGQATEEALLRMLRNRRALIVLDNCEHVAMGCAGLVRRLLSGAPKLQVLATSREPLRITGELAFPLPPLTLPDDGQDLPPDALGAFEATRLFLERAGAALPGFVADAGQARALLRICRHLDGVPLAIELAAARLRVMSLDDIERRLGQVFSLLVGGERGAEPRQQALRATIDWSHDLLDDGERVVFRRLAAFAGSWTLDAAEAVVAGDRVPAERVPELLGRLVEKSLVMRAADGRRYRFLQTMRQYAQDRLTTSGEGPAVRDRHLACYLSLAEQARGFLSGPMQAEWLARLDAEQENLMAAHAWCGQTREGGTAGLRLAFALKLYLYNRGQFEIMRWSLEEALGRADAQPRTSLRCKVVHTMGQVLGVLGRRDEAMPHLQEALAIAEEVGEHGRAAMVLQEMGMSALAQGDMETSRGYLERGLERASVAGDRRQLVAAVTTMAHWHRVQGELAPADAMYRRAFDLASELRDQQTISVAVMNLAIVAMARGDQAAACRLLRQAGGIALALSSRPAGQCLLALGSGLAALRRDWRRAARLAAASLAETRQTGMFLDPADRAFLDPLWARARDELGPAAHAAESETGRSQGYDDSMSEMMGWLQAVEGPGEAFSR